MRVLLVVESPTKAKTLKTYLGKGFQVIASKGHIKDLPEKELGVDLKTFSPKYQVLKGKMGVIKFIREMARGADLILLGSDPDREGEAIAYHIFEEIKSLKKQVKRVLFFEITPEAVKSAINNPTDIDLRKVESQKARRVLDRLVGYLISPILWKKLRWGLSAGRVQSAALRLIVEREREIRSFVPKTFWYFEVELEKGGKTFKARSEKNFFDEREAREIYERLKKGTFKVIEFNRKTVKQNPPPPLKTSTLQQEANNLFGLSAGKTMEIAQSLYEGVEIEGKRVGLITYHRTDSTRLSERGVNLIRSTIKALFPEEYLSKTKRTYGKDRGNVQGAHEAIRPTYPNIKPWDLRGKLNELSLKVYELIWRRALASQMSPLEYELREVKISAGGINFVAEGREVKFEGWTKVLPHELRGEDIPDLKIGEELKVRGIKLKKDKTKPKPRFTEASLVEELEKLGIGRPSTYATIIKTLFARKYVIKKGKTLVPTEIGEKVLDELLKFFPEIFDYRFTAKMEEELDKIEEGKKGYLDVVKEFYLELWPKIERANGSPS
ncbi:MAG: type I DNA topoisomerase [Candidatus Caldipriscus sp.]|nr:type I DNA topoisomerase [Candidatus Caldipriscus sp.]